MIAGYGDIGQRVAQLWLNAGAEIFALARQPDKASGQINYIQADLDQADTLHNIPAENAVIYYFAPPPFQGNTDTRLENFLSAIPTDKSPTHIIYISTSGVYGDCQGKLITESQPLQPITTRAQRRLAAEQALLAWAKQRQTTTVILRVGGIYGPGRLPLERLKQGMMVLRRDLAPVSNRIHADDLALICHAAIRAPGQHTIYNVCDNQPGTMSDYFFAVARYARLPEPVEVDWQEAETRLSPAMLSYLHESRRMDNSKVLRELTLELTYPDMESGLRACFT